MIVKNEAHVIERAIKSVQPYISSWAICDTGSTDGTQEIIGKVLSDIPGRLVQHAWKNFGHNRSLALSVAKPLADYVLILDADEIFEVNGEFHSDRLAADSYRIRKFRGPYSYYVPNIVKSSLDWRWVGVIHEYLECDEERETVHLDEVWINSPPDGARSKSAETYRRDASVLEEALIEEPENARYVFYLANAYRDCGDIDLAIKNYERRAAMEGWEEEVFAALWRLGECRLARGDKWPDCLATFLRAHERAPNRAEPLFVAGRAAAKRNDWATAFLLLSRAADIPHPGHVGHLIMEDVYQFRALLDAGAAAHQLRLFDQAIEFNERLMGRASVPAFWRDKANGNRQASKAAANRYTPD